MNARAAIAVLLLAAASGSALAGTNVGGPINVNTTWTAAGAPYTVTSDVTIGSGATLTIDAGVTVYMNAGTNLVVASGSLAAVGTSPSPIVITSFRDIPNPNPVPAPGDWGQLQFGAGTIAGATQLDYVQVKYGAGVSITGASPALNHLTLANNQGPAITVDLASSPTGGGLAATGNSLNGILVPAGDINADITWGLTGIPYVVAQGVVNVGAPPPVLTLAPANATVGNGYTLPMTVTSSVAAPAGGLAVTLTSSNGAAVSVPASVTIPANATSVGFSATGVATGSATITAHATGYGDATALVDAQTANIGVPANALVAPGLTIPLPITLSIPAPPGGTTVNLASDKGSVATVTASVPIAAGATTGSATVTGVAAGTATITATATNYGAGTTGVTVANITLDVAPSGTINVPQGVAQSYQVMLSQAAPAGGVTVNVGTGNPATATVSPASVTVAQGQTLSATTIDVQGVATGATTLTLSVPGLNSKIITVNVLGQGNIAFNHTSATLGTGLTIAAGTSNYLIKLFSGAANFFNPVPVTVTLTSSDPSKVSVPPSVVVPAGNGFAAVQLNGVGITAAPVTITATAAGYQPPPTPISVSVVAPSVLFQSLDNARVTTNNLRDDFTVRWSVPDGFNPNQTSTADIALDLSITDQIPAGIVPGFHNSAVGGSVVTQLTIPAGQNVSGTAYVDQPTVAGSYTVTASAPGIGSGTSSVQTVTSPALQLPVGVTIGAGMTSVPNAAKVTRTGSTAASLDVALSCAPASVCGVPATVTIPAAATSVSVPLTGVAVGSATLTATSAGYTTATMPVTTEAPHFFTSSSGTTVAAGSTLPISIGFGGGGEIAETSATDVIVSLSSSAPTVASIPATMTIPAGATFADAPLLGVSAGTATITVSSPGFVTASTVPYTVTAPPTLRLAPAVGQVNIGSTLAMSVISNQTAPAGGIAVTLSSSNSGFVSVPASVVIPGFGISAPFNATGVANGTATLTAHAAGYVDGTASITGGAQALVLANSQVAVGQTRTLTITLSNPAPAGGLTISLQSSDTNIATVPASINVPAGATTATFDAFGVGNGSPFAFTYINAGFWNVTLTATAPAYSPATMNLAVSNFVIELKPLTSFDIPQGVVQTYQIALTSQSPTETVTVNLASADSGTLTVVPSSVTVLPGQKNATTTIDVTGIAKGVTTIDATALGLAPVSFNANVLDPGMLVLSPSSMVLGKGMLTSDLVVQLSVAGGPYYSPVPTTVSLTSGDPAKVSVPASVVIPAGWGSQSVTVTGLDFTATPVAVSAFNSVGYANAAAADVTVQAPSFAFLGLSGVRIVNNRRDAFQLRVLPPASNVAQSLVNLLNVDLAITDQNPAGIVGGFHNLVTGGTAISQATIAASNGFSSVIAVDSPTTAGTYTVTASVPGLASTTSAVQVVSPNAQLTFPVTSYVVGKGLSYSLAVERIVDDQLFFDDGPLVINLTSSDPSKVSVPASVTISADTYFTYVPVTGVDLTGGPVTIDATASGYASPSTKLSVSVVVPHLLLFGLDEARRLDSVEDYFYPSWYVPENVTNPYNQTAAQDTTVQLTVTDQSPAGIVDGIFGDSLGTTTSNQMVIPAGNDHGTGYVGRPLVPSGTYTVTATATGPSATTAVSTVQTVTTAAPVVEFTQLQAVVGVGFMAYADGQIQVTRSVLGFPFFAVDDATVTLNGVDPNGATVPETVTIPASDAYAPFSVVGLQPEIMSVTASAPGYVTGQALDLQIVTPILEFEFGPDPPQVPAGGTLDFFVNLYAPNAYPSGQTSVIDFLVNLQSANEAVLTLSVPSYLIPSGSTFLQASFQIMGVATGTTTLTASSPNLADVVSVPIQVVP